MNTTAKSMESHHSRSMEMPVDEQEILDAFEEVLAKMDLPPDKMRILRNCDMEKKWKLVCDQNQFSTDHSITEPHVYLDKLKAFMDKKAVKKKKKLLAGDSPTTILKHIEISLRTNSIEWVQSFLSPANDGLQVIVEYLTHLQESFFSILLHAETRCDNGVSHSHHHPTTSTGLAAARGPPLECFANEESIHLQSPSLHCPNNNFSASGSSASSIPTINTTAPYASLSKHDSLVGEKNAMPISRRLSSAKSNGKASKQAKNMMDIEDEQHICLMLFRSLLNNRFGFAKMFANREAIYCIVRCLNCASLRTKTLALDMLSGIVVLDEGQNKGHDLVLGCFNRFQRDYNETFRFQSLLSFFQHPPEMSIDFLSSVIKFVNVLVHKSEDLNERVALQYEFSSRIDTYLDDLLKEYPESELLNHCNLYWENCIDIQALTDKALKYEFLTEKVADLQEALSRQREEYQVLQSTCFLQIAQLNQQKAKLVEERAELERQKDEKISTLTRDWRERERTFDREKSSYESRITLLEKMTNEMKQGLKAAQNMAHSLQQQQQQQKQNNEQQAKVEAKRKVQSPPKELHEPTRKVTPPTAPQAATPTTSSTTTTTVPAPKAVLPAASAPSVSAPPPPPPPPPPPMALSSKASSIGKKSGAPPPPPPLPPPRLLGAGGSEPMPTKRVAKLKARMPMLNMVPLTGNQVKGTVFNSLNDEKLVDLLDLKKLEEMFCLEEKATPSTTNLSTQQGGLDANNVVLDKRQPSPISMAQSGGGASSGTGKKTFLSTKRLQNIAIIRRKIGKSVMEIMAAVHRFDFSALTSDQVDILLPIIPTPDEIARLREFGQQNGNNFESLTAEDQFLARLMDIEKLTLKLTLMKFMSDFDDNVQLLIPVLQKITTASKAIRSAKKFPKVIELILAIGNAMNGAKRAPIYGFKIASLDSLSILKSPRDRNYTLMHLLAEIIAQKFPDLRDFPSEISHLAEGAATANLEILKADIKDIESKFSQALSEQNRKGKEETPESLNKFIESASPQLNTLLENLKLAQESFKECSEYYGETTATVPDVFFTRIASFCKHYENALTEYESRKSAEKRQEREEQRRKSAQSRRNLRENGQQQEKIIDELSQKLGHRSVKTFKDGDFDALMAELKETGFVAPNAANAIRIRRKSPSPNRQQLSVDSGNSRERAS